ncbi:DUF6882 domain-containing protein [Micromonospora sp. DT178]|uniref:DUF6882 domain-containing protein n=1 Tax=Micromonospora sp. DT178 TaxID=3393436 RepID=UPI003CE7FF98
MAAPPRRPFHLRQQLCGWLREYGHHHGVAEFTEPTFPLQRADGHRLALLASGLTDRCYYRGPYPGGAAFFHLDDAPPQITAPLRPERRGDRPGSGHSGLPGGPSNCRGVVPAPAVVAPGPGAHVVDRAPFRRFDSARRHTCRALLSPRRRVGPRRGTAG